MRLFALCRGKILDLDAEVFALLNFNSFSNSNRYCIKFVVVVVLLLCACLCVYILKLVVDFCIFQCNQRLPKWRSTKFTPQSISYGA